MLADKNEAWFLLDKAPANYRKPTVADFADAENVSDQLFDDGSYLRPSGSETTKEPFISGDQNESFGQDNFEGQASAALFADEDSAFWEALGVKGASAWVATRSLKAYDAEVEVDDLVSIFQVMSDTPQPPQSREGYQKRIIPLAVQKASTDVKVATS